MEAVTTQLKEIPRVPGEVVRSVISAPIAAFAMLVFILLVVLVVEAYKPGLLTGIPRKILTAVGVKSA